MRFAPGAPVAGRYLLLDELSTGPRATVWRGMDDVLGRPVAVKLCLAAQSRPGADAARSWVHARARSAARLNHPHVTAVYDYGDVTDAHGALTPYIVMELLDGEPLAVRGVLPWPMAVRTLAETAAALAAAHARGVVHGGLDASSVMLTRAGAKLLGFTGPSRPPLTPATPADDVFDLGALLALTVGAANNSDLREVVPDLPEAVCTLADRCRLPRPADRPSMHAAAAVLATAATRHAASAPDSASVLIVPVPAAAPPGDDKRPWSRRIHTGLAAAGVTGVLLLSGLAATYGDDLIAAATGAPQGTPGASSTHGRPGPRSQSAPTTGAAVTTGPVETSAPTNSSRSTPRPTAGSRPGSSPADLPPAAAQALAQLRASVDNGRAAGEITPDTASQLDEAIDDIANRLSLGEAVRGQVNALRQRVDSWVRMEEITAARAADLYQRLDAFAEAAPR